MRKWMLTLGIFLIAAPVFLLLGAALSPQPPILWLPAPAVAVLIALAAHRAPKKARALCIVAAAAAAFAATLLLGWHLQAGLRGLLPAAVSALLVLLHARLLMLPPGSVHESLWYIGLACYPAARIIGAMAVLDQVPSPLRVCALIYAMYAFFALMGQSLWSGMGGRRAPSRLMLVRGGLLAGILAALLLILSNISQLKRALRAAVHGVIRAIGWLASLLPSTGGGAGGGSGGGMDLSMLAGETEPPSPWMLLLEQILKVLATILALALAFALVYLLFRALARGIKALIARLRAYINAVNGDYVDTVESLVDWGEVRRAAFHRAKPRHSRANEPPWEQLDMRQRVRRSYRDYLRRHPETPDQATARQTLGDDRLAAIYEFARYSSREITPQDAEQARTLDKRP